MGQILKVDYHQLAEIYSKKGKAAAKEFLINSGVKAPDRAIKRMKENYMYDEELNMYIVPENDKPKSKAKHDTSPSPASTEDSFMSMDEICNLNVVQKESVKKAGDCFLSFPAKTNDELITELIMEKLTEYTGFFTIDKTLGVCHINKSKILREGFKIYMY